LKNSDRVMNQAFWIGVYPGLGKEALDYVTATLHHMPVASHAVR